MNLDLDMQSICKKYFSLVSTLFSQPLIGNSILNLDKTVLCYNPTFH